jgi:DNA-binding MarR family transcriptional regulator
VELASDLVMYAARLLRVVRREHELPASIRIVSILDELGPLGITQLADLDRCSQPTMSAAVAQLAEKDLVIKAPNPNDARGSVVTLTAEGREELARVRRLNGESVAARLSSQTSHTAEEVATAVAVLRDLVGTTGTTQEGIS